MIHNNDLTRKLYESRGKPVENGGGGVGVGCVRPTGSFERRATVNENDLRASPDGHLNSIIFRAFTKKYYPIDEYLLRDTT